MGKIKKKTIKCIVWDLDNTIWEGILSENDSLVLRNNIKMIIKEIDKRGIINSIASKNNYEDAINQLKLFEIDEYFLYPQINWNNKSDSIRFIVEKLNIAYDSIAFIDDQAFERDEVKSMHPELNCFDIDVTDKLLTMAEFMPRFITDESTLRRKMYMQDEVRKQEEIKIGSNIAFLESLDMEFIISHATIKDLQRVEELTIRTNQLNSTGYHYTYEELESFLSSPDHHLFVTELVDKYGSYGKIGVALIENKKNTLVLKLLLMSCRVISRGVGTVFLQFIANMAIKNNLKLQADFFPTDRNRLMYITYKFLGFKEVDKLEENGILLELSSSELLKTPNYVKVISLC